MKYNYDLIVIGGGSAGLVAATGSAGLGARTAMIEKGKLGGDCTLYGCVPSKALLRSAHVLSLARRIGEFGITTPENVNYDTSGVMGHVRDVVEKIRSHHPPEVFENKGIKVLFGAPKFIDSRTIELDGDKISSKRFILCMGSHPLVPPIEGLKDIDYLTNENIFDLQELPGSLAVLGGGPIGLEMAQAFSDLGVKVDVIEALDRPLFREDEETAQVVIDCLKKGGTGLHAGKKAVKFTKEGGLVDITVEDDKDHTLSVIKAEKVLIAVGRAPNVEGLDLERAGIKYSKKGIQVNEALRTTVKNIYACGDVVGPYQFSHMAEYQAVIAVSNAIFPFKQKVNYNAVPWVTFTDPELAHLGMTEEEARKKYTEIKVYKSEYKSNDRAVTDLNEKGLAKVICDKKGHILGAHIAGTNAGDIIHEYVLAKSSKLTIGKLSSAIHAYPTFAQVVKRSADQYYFDLLNSGWFKAITRFMLKFLK